MSQDMFPPIPNEQLGEVVENMFDESSTDSEFQSTSQNQQPHQQMNVPDSQNLPVTNSYRPHSPLTSPSGSDESHSIFSPRVFNLMYNSPIEEALISDVLMEE
ncbi:uncharacterized protein LOC142318294 [Lycorma delicatula]|uniref:uncharacterized protein LOC142318294 n=1 Tax=Lycorma delicatula TaxID=130591 RepID=UPI003F517205